MPAFGSASAILWASVRGASSWSLRSNSRRVVPAGSPHWADFSMIRSGRSAELRAFASLLLTPVSFGPMVLMPGMRSRVAEVSLPARSNPKWQVGQIASGQPRFFSVSKHPLAGDIAGVAKTVDAENPPGQWNRVEILARGPRYSVRMNGKEINAEEGVEVVAGPIGLQSEGGVIQFRRATLTILH